VLALHHQVVVTGLRGIWAWAVDEVEWEVVEQVQTVQLAQVQVVVAVTGHQVLADQAVAA
jgi:hypothetical protein